MKEMFKDICECAKNTKLTKHYDCKTEFSCGKCEGAPFIMTTKGDFSVNAIEIACILGAMAVIGISSAIVKKLRS